MNSMAVHSLMAIVTALAVELLYLSNRQQTLLNRSLARKWRYVGMLLLSMTLFCVVAYLKTASAVFLWLSQLMVLASILPWLSYRLSIKLKRKKADYE